MPINNSSKLEDVYRFNVTNKYVFELLYNAINNERIILPFVGSGISYFVYQATWGELLLDMANTFFTGQDDIVLGLINQKEYTQAAQYIRNKVGDVIFYRRLRDFFSEDKISDDELRQNAAYYIPMINYGNCLTTNYDRVIEHACMLRNINYDVTSCNDINKLATFLRSNSGSGMIFKIHGDILSNRDDILLTEDAYRKSYSSGSNLNTQLKRWISNKQFLFIGTSIIHDRYVELLREQLQEGMYNYAIFACKENELPYYREEFDRLSIIPLFYDANDHTKLTEILRNLIA